MGEVQAAEAVAAGSAEAEEAAAAKAAAEAEAASACAAAAEEEAPFLVLLALFCVVDRFEDGAEQLVIGELDLLGLNDEPCDDPHLCP